MRKQCGPRHTFRNRLKMVLEFVIVETTEDFPGWLGTVLRTAPVLRSSSVTLGGAWPPGFGAGAVERLSGSAWRSLGMS